MIIRTLDVTSSLLPQALVHSPSTGLAMYCFLNPLSKYKASEFLLFVVLVYQYSVASVQYADTSVPVGMPTIGHNALKHYVALKGLILSRP